MILKLPRIKRLVDQRDDLARQLETLQKQMRFENGHFYSPVPSDVDIEQRYKELNDVSPNNLPGIDLQLEAQLDWCQRIAKHYGELPFEDQPTKGLRYYYDNQTFCSTDAILLYGMLRELQPNRIVEIGSGFSSAVMLDTNERFMKSPAEMTFVEPFPERLVTLLGENDRQGCRIVESRIQDVTDSPWSALTADDILFIDSSHVSKCGSDVNRLFFDIIPSVASGVVIHVHDVFPHFEYPESWVRNGRYWTEDYLLRAFLQFNQEFEIMLWGPFMVESNSEFFTEKMPRCLANSGGSLWMRRK